MRTPIIVDGRGLNLPEYDSGNSIGPACSTETAILPRDGCDAYEFAHRIQASMAGIDVPMLMAFYSFGG